MCCLLDVLVTLLKVLMFEVLINLLVVPKVLLDILMISIKDFIWHPLWALFFLKGLLFFLEASLLSS